ncbi:MAG: efflux RND transporter permease subunit [Pseudomonadota bacterium]
MRSRGVTQLKGIIAWFAANHVAANLLMFIIVVAGLISLVTIRKEMNPQFEINFVNVEVAYPGASPSETEEGIVVKIEEAIQDLTGIKRVIGRAYEGAGGVTAEIEADLDLDQVMNEIKIRVDSISTFPGLAERPIVSKVEFLSPVILLTVYGDLDEFARKGLGQEIRDELLAHPDINDVIFFGDRDYEISIEVSELTLREYRLTLDDVAQAVRNSSLDLPGGAIRTDGGNVRLRTTGQAYTGNEFSDIVLRTFPDGTRLELGDIATIRDGFVETDAFSRFNGKAAATLQVTAGGQQNELVTAAAVKNYVAEKRERLPDGVELETWIDLSYYLEGRLDMMQSNMITGAILVFIVLSLFLRVKVAFWVIIGLPVTFLGCLWLMPLWPISINVLSLFGFIMVLGIVVDDAIIIGESVYTRIRADGHTLDNVILGAKRVALPATFGVLTTIAAFAPLMFVGPPAGSFFEAMGFVVIACLLFSLVESKLILPAHLSRAKIDPVDDDDLFNPQRTIPFIERPGRSFLKLQRRLQRGLHRFITDVYRPLLEKAVDNRGITACLFFAALIITVGVLSSGLTRFVLLPDLPQDFTEVDLYMEDGSSPESRDAAAKLLEETLLNMNDEYIAANPGEPPMIRNLGVFSDGETGVDLFVEFPRDTGRELTSDDIINDWRERVGEIPGMKELTFSNAGRIGGGPPLGFQLSGADYPTLARAADQLKAEISNYEGVYDVNSSFSAGAEEVRLSIKPEAEALGLSVASLGRQVRQAFFGEEAQRIQRGSEELKVMVRYPEAERRSLSDLQNMRIRTPSGDEVPFSAVADMAYDESYAVIQRLNGKRSVTIAADLDYDVAEPGEVFRTIETDFVPALLADFPGVDYAREGSAEEEQELVLELSIAFAAAMFLIYALIAIPLHSYSQPLLIMSVIPFGIIGAVFGHIVMGKAISMFSMFGLVALAGVVVNDSLIMMDFINRAREQGIAAREAVIQSGVQRFRAIILTSFTTAAGLTPIMLETSTQAQFVIPTAISLSFGIVFATVITLLLIPCLYLLQLDFLRMVDRAWRLLLGRPVEPAS